ncbi:MAG: efflux RND transporter periplasmic adaptor subunit [Xanthobacter sp.]
MPERSPRAGRIAIVVLGLAILGGAGWLWQHKPWATTGPTSPVTAGLPQSPRAVAVLVSTAQRKGMPVRVEALGTVEPMVTVPIRARVAGTVERVDFEDGAQVKAGELLFTLDPRVMDAQIRQAEATLARDKAQLEKTGRDVARYSGLVTRNAISQVQLEDSQTALDVQKAVVTEGEARLDALKVERSYYDIAAPVSGRMGVSSVRKGAVIRVDETLATVRQLRPIYVTFGLPERYLRELRADRQQARVAITLQGTGERIEGGRVAVIDNMVDTQTGTVPVRALFENADEHLWPGTLGAVTLTLRIDPDVVVVPSEAVRVGQDGAFVFVVEDGVARIRPVKVARTVDGESVIASGLKGGETVVRDGQLALRNGSAVNVKAMAVPVPALPSSPSAQPALGG